MEQLAATMGGHQITGEDGKPIEETEQEPVPVSEPAAEETEPEDTGIVKEQDQEEPTNPLTSDELVEDDSGKKYVPQKRFDEVYAKLKSLEREQAKKPTSSTPTDLPVELSKTDKLETEMLYSTMPEFDPKSDKYSEELDILGSQIFLANPGVTKLEAARRARTLASKLNQKREAARNSARDYKSQTTEGSFASKPLAGRSTQVDPEKMSLEEMESFLKANGQW